MFGSSSRSSHAPFLPNAYSSSLPRACSSLLPACSFCCLHAPFCDTHAPLLLYACSSLAPCMLLLCSWHAPPPCCSLHAPWLPCVDQSDQRTAAASMSSLRRSSHNSLQRDFRRRSLSPDRLAPLQRSFPPVKAAASSRRPDFQAGTGGRVYSACAVCLGRHPHKVIDCTAAMLWDNSLPTLATRSNKVLVMRDSRALCADWQRAAGCPTSRHDNCHICSGCASTSHGSQECP